MRNGKYRGILPESNGYEYFGDGMRVVVPEGVKYIGDTDFDHCSNIVILALPKSLIYISEMAIGKLHSLKRIKVAEGNINYHLEGNCLIETQTKQLVRCLKNGVIPDDGSVVSVSSYAFGQADALEELYIGEHITEIGCLYAYTKLNKISISEKNKVLRYINGCVINTVEKTLLYGFDNAVIPNDGSVVTIGNKAFYNREKLKEIIIPSGVINIEEEAFKGCTELEYVTLPHSIKKLGEGAFCACKSLKEVYVGDGVEHFGRGVFEGCDSLRSISLPFVGENNGQGSNYFCYVFGAKTKFSECEEVPKTLRNVEIRNAKRLTNQCFFNCDKIENISLLGIEDIGCFAFRNCRALKSIHLSSAVKVIGSLAFDNCRSLERIVIPKNVEQLGNELFRDCFSLKSVVFEDCERWYIIENSMGWINKEGGTAIDLSNDSLNATKLLFELSALYLYKK